MTVNVCTAQFHLSLATGVGSSSSQKDLQVTNVRSSSFRISSPGRLNSTFLPESKLFRTSARSRSRSSSVVGKGKGASRVVAGLGDYVGGDLLGFDLDKWSSDVDEYGSIGIYAPAEGGYEGRYATRLRREGYHILNLTARGLGDPEVYLTKIHGVRPAHLGKQAIARWYLPPEVDYRLSLLPKDCKGLVVWLIECKVLSKTELQFLALLPALRPKVKVIAEVGTWRSFRWKPLKEIAGLPMTTTGQAAEAPAAPVPTPFPEVEKEKKPADKVIA